MRRWFCIGCNRALNHDESDRGCRFDTVTATKGGATVTHDNCGGRVAWSQREVKG